MDTAPEPTHSRPRPAPWAAPGLIAAGVALRLETWLDNRSLWNDEAALAMALRGRDLGEVLAPLPQLQAAPTGFLLAARGVMAGLGDSEPVLRLLPLLAALAVLPLFWVLARRLLDPPAALLALGLFVLAPHLIYYAAEFKPYAFDVLGAVGILLASLHLHRSGYTVRAALAAALVGAVAVLFSYAAIFTLAGATLALLMAWWRGTDRDPGVLGVILALGGVWLAAFGADWWLVTAARRDPAYQAYFAQAWPPLPATAADVAWYWNAMVALVERPLGFYRGPVLVALVILAGALVLWRERPFAFWLLVAPLLFVALAAVLRQYPPVNRLLLFTVPAALLLLATGAARMARSLGALHRALGVVLVLFIVAGPAVSGVKRLLTQEVRQELREPVAYLLEHVRPGDRIYVFEEARPAFRYYTRDRELAWIEGSDTTTWFEDETAGADLSGRVWFVSLDARPDRFVLRLKPVRESERASSSVADALLDRRGRRLDQAEDHGAGVYLYRL